ncbi:MAG: hypothetical protein ACRD4P_10720 [Bryobacteraceae bacterium]
MDRNSAISQLIRRADRRRLLLILFERAAFSLALFLCGFIVLLITGVQPLDWLWLGLLLAASFAAAFFRRRGPIASPYQTAQILDRRLEFHDALSTAWHFAGHPAPPHSRDAAEAQRASAETLARSASITDAFPFHPSRAHYALLATAFISASLFALRYGVTRSLDLSPPLIRIAEDTNTINSGVNRKTERRDLRARIREELAALGIPGASAISKVSDPRTMDNAFDSAGESAVSDSSRSPANAQKTPTLTENGKQSANRDGNANGDGEDSDAGNAESREAQPSKSEASSSSPAAPQQAPSPASRNAQSASLIDKMRDAVSNLVSSLKHQPSSNSGQQPSGPQPQGSQSARQGQQSETQKGNPSDSSRRADSENQSQTSAQAAQSSQTAQSAQGRSSDKSANHPPADGAQSGIGLQDGAKETKLAEELAAMGKISEIIGKRSANVSGEIMVEVPSGKQQLKTPYSQRAGQHLEGGGEINRDEVPLAYQEYVQQYFEQIRKSPPGPKFAPQIYNRE